MKSIHRIALLAALLSPLVASAAGNVPVTAPVSPESYRVFVDLPTGYMFVQTPYGWKFRGQLAHERYAEMPVGTYVSLLPSARVDVAIATADIAVMGTTATGSH